jgi:hypothetical protein
MTAPDNAIEPTRRELERTAFGRAETPDEIAAAQDALRRLVDEDAAAAAAARPSDEVETAGPSAASEDVPEHRSPPLRRRTLVPLLVVVGLFAGAVVGILLSHPESTPAPLAGAESVTPSPAPTPNPAAALKSLLVSQTKADKGYPLPEGSGPFPIQPASVHRIMTASDGATLWTGRSDTGICLMSTRNDAANGSTGGTITCATPSEFAVHGLTLAEGTNLWTWNGVAFTTTVGE